MVCVAGDGNGVGDNMNDLSQQLIEMKKQADFGKAVIELAKTYGFVPKRQIVKTVTKEKIKIVTRRPRRTRAEIAADAAAASTTSYEDKEAAKTALDALVGS